MGHVLGISKTLLLALFQCGWPSPLQERCMVAFNNKPSWCFKRSHNTQEHSLKCSHIWMKTLSYVQDAKKKLVVSFFMIIWVVFGSGQCSRSSEEELQHKYLTDSLVFLLSHPSCNKKRFVKVSSGPFFFFFFLEKKWPKPTKTRKRSLLYLIL